MLTTREHGNHRESQLAIKHSKWKRNYINPNMMYTSNYFYIIQSRICNTLPPFECITKNNTQNICYTLTIKFLHLKNTHHSTSARRIHEIQEYNT